MSWLPITLGLLIIGVPAIFFSLIYLAARYETNALRPLAPAVGHDDHFVGAKCREAIDEAIAQGFSNLGLFSDGDPGWREGIVRILLSSERDVLLVAKCSRLMDTYELITQLPDSVWLLTTNLGGLRDLSGLDDKERMVGVPFRTVLEAHLRRLADRGVIPVLFEPTAITQTIYTHQSARVERMLQLGLVQWKDPIAKKWRYTATGASALREATRGSMSGLRQDMQKAKDFERGS